MTRSPRPARLQLQRGSAVLRASRDGAYDFPFACTRSALLSACQSVAIYRAMLKRPLPPGFIVPAQPVEREKPPVGAEWVHEIKHDGYRMIVRKEGDNVR